MLLFPYSTPPPHHRRSRLDTSGPPGSILKARLLLTGKSFGSGSSKGDRRWHYLSRQKLSAIQCSTLVPVVRITKQPPDWYTRLSDTNTHHRATRHKPRTAAEYVGPNFVDWCWSPLLRGLFLFFLFFVFFSCVLGFCCTTLGEELLRKSPVSSKQP